MKATDRDRLALSIVAEPVDPLLRQVVAEHGIGAVAAACRGESGAPEVPAAWVERLAADPVDRALERAEAAGARWVTPGRLWPASVDDLDGLDQPVAPWGLWVRGDGMPALERSVSVVGARACTTYGAEVAGDLGADLADRGWTVVSGAAFGIDACAHRGALAVAGRTVAVLACGADVAYPRAHANLLERIVDEGWVLSEYPPGSAPQRHRFLTRNRLIAAVSAGTVVVEAAPRSGSLNTLRWADRLGRASMAVPGPVVSRQSGGTHQALRSGEAVLVASADDVAEELETLGWRDVDPRSDLTETARLVQEALVRGRLDEVDLPTRQVRAALQLLERRGLARRASTGWAATSATVGP